jgi:hypothetical protein
LAVSLSYHPFGSDHMPFLNHEIPALLAIGASWPEYDVYYHTSRDTFDKCSPSLAIAIGRGICGALVDLAGQTAFQPSTIFVTATSAPTSAPTRAPTSAPTPAPTWAALSPSSAATGAPSSSAPSGAGSAPAGAGAASVRCAALTALPGGSGTISDGSGTYRANEACRWQISGPAVELRFTAFELEAGCSTTRAILR